MHLNPQKKPKSRSLGNEGDRINRNSKFEIQRFVAI